MTTSATVPVTVTPEAAARIAELGFQGQVQRMIDHACQRLPGLVRIEVVLNERYDAGEENGVLVAAYCRDLDDPSAETLSELARWAASAFPPEVLLNLLLSYYEESGHAG
jgi:hypothetical protein